MTDGRYYCTHLHMHSCYEGVASMEGHMYEAKRMGMMTIWFTDHDYRMGRKEHPVEGFDFEGDGLIVFEDNSEIHEKVTKKQKEVESFGVYLDVQRWERARKQLEKSFTLYNGWTQPIVENLAAADFTLTNERAFKGTQSLKITAEDNSDGNQWHTAALSFVSSGNRHQFSLLSQVNLRIAFFVDEAFEKDIRVIFDIKMSQHPPEHKTAHIKYVIGSTDGLEQEYVTVIPREVKTMTWNRIEMNLSEDSKRYGVGGLDNVFDTITISMEVRNQKKATCYLDDFQIESKFSYEQVRSRQRELAEKLGLKYDIIPFVATEISSAGQHKNSFCTNVPIIDYENWGYQVSHLDAIQWVKNHGGIFSLNHPFDTWKRIPLLSEEKKKIVEETVNRYISSKCDGANLLEVGFPLGRDQFNLEDYLTLWDALSEKGIFITGYGDSDNHSNDGGWWNGNNFAAWIYAKVPVEEHLIQSMKNGNVFTGDPAIFKGEIVFKTLEGYGMGKVIKSSRSSWCLIFKASSLNPGWNIQWVVDGKRENPIVVEEQYIGHFELEIVKDIHFVRVELYNENGRCILLTNPIYFVSKDNLEIPEDRLINCK